jgi:hypothetical protein
MHPVAFRTITLPPTAQAQLPESAALPKTTGPVSSTPAGVIPTETSAAAASTQPHGAGVDRRPPTPAGSFSAADLEALQSTDHGKAASSPAAQARAAIADNPDLASVPFGHIVSQIARGETPVVSSEGEPEAPTPPAPENVSEPPAADAGSPPDTTTTASGDTAATPGEEPSVSEGVTPENDPSAPSDVAATETTSTEPPANIDVAPEVDSAMDNNQEQQLLDALSA